MLFQGSGFSLMRIRSSERLGTPSRPLSFLPDLPFFDVGVSFALLSASHLRTSAYSH